MIRKILFCASLGGLLLVGVPAIAHSKAAQNQSGQQSQATKSISGKVASIGDNGKSFVVEVDSKTQLGWTAGVGFEHMFDAHWTLRGEFRYIDLGRTSVLPCVPAVAGLFCDGQARFPRFFQGQFSDTLIAGLVGLGYKF